MKLSRPAGPCANRAAACWNTEPKLKPQAKKWCAISRYHPEITI